MNLREIAKQTLATLRAHKMRSFLTMFGIMWGIASVIILVGLGLGFRKEQKKRMETLGKDLVIMWGGRTSAQIGGLAAGRKITLTISDARLIRDECYQVKLVSPELQRNVPEVSPYNSAARQISGVWALVSELPLASARRRTSADRGGRKQSEPRRDPGVECCPPALPRAARHRHDADHRQVSLHGRRSACRKEAELELQRTRQ